MLALGAHQGAQDLLAFIARDLGMPEPRARWVARGSARDAAHARARGRLVIERPRTVAGMFVSGHEGSVFLHLRANAFAVAHEARHYWQHRTLPDFWERLGDELESDASAYARQVVPRWRAARAKARS